MKYVCDVCGYIYDPAVGDPDNGIEAGTAFEALPEDWVCPLLRRWQRGLLSGSVTLTTSEEQDREAERLSRFSLLLAMDLSLLILRETL